MRNLENSSHELRIKTFSNKSSSGGIKISIPDRRADILWNPKPVFCKRVALNRHPLKRPRIGRQFIKRISISFQCRDHEIIYCYRGTVFPVNMYIESEVEKLIRFIAKSTFGCARENRLRDSVYAAGKNVSTIYKYIARNREINESGFCLIEFRSVSIDCDFQVEWPSQRSDRNVSVMEQVFSRVFVVKMIAGKARGIIYNIKYWFRTRPSDFPLYFGLNYLWTVNEITTAF